MNGNPLALPDSHMAAEQQAQIAAALDQNERLLATQNRATAVGLAVQLASQDQEIQVVLGNALKINHYLTTGHVPAEAKR